MFIEGLDPGGSKNEKDCTNYVIGIFNKKTYELRILDGFQNKATPAHKDVECIRQLRTKWDWNRKYHYLSIADNQICKGEKVSSVYDTLKKYLDTSLGVNWIACNYKNIKNGIDRVKRWWDLGLIKINNHLDFAMEEIKNYTTATKKTVIKGTDAIKEETYFIDKNNHFIDTLRYMIVVLEEKRHNPETLQNEIYKQTIYNQETASNIFAKREWNPHDQIIQLVIMMKHIYRHIIVFLDHHKQEQKYVD